MHVFAGLRDEMTSRDQLTSFLSCGEKKVYVSRALSTGRIALNPRIFPMAGCEALCDGHPFHLLPGHRAHTVYVGVHLPGERRHRRHHKHHHSQRQSFSCSNEDVDNDRPSKSILRFFFRISENCATLINNNVRLCSTSILFKQWQSVVHWWKQVTFLRM